MEALPTMLNTPTLLLPSPMPLQDKVLHYPRKEPQQQHEQQQQRQPQMVGNADFVSVLNEFIRLLSLAFSGKVQLQ